MRALHISMCFVFGFLHFVVCFFDCFCWGGPVSMLAMKGTGLLRLTSQDGGEILAVA